MIYSLMVILDTFFPERNQQHRNDLMYLEGEPTVKQNSAIIGSDLAHLQSKAFKMRFQSMGPGLTSKPGLIWLLLYPKVHMIMVVVHAVHVGWQAFSKWDSPSPDLPSRRWLKEIVLQVDVRITFLMNKPLARAASSRARMCFPMVSKSIRTNWSWKYSFKYMPFDKKCLFKYQSI